MYQVIYQEDNKIEIALTGELSNKEFKEVIHQLESLCTMYAKINVLFLADQLKTYSLSLVFEEFDFYKNYKGNLEKVGIVSKSNFQKALVSLFDNFTDTDIRYFSSDQIEEARKWIFPSRLP